MKHYTKEELDLYRHGKMSVLSRINCTSHLKECQEYAKLLEELKEDDQLLAHLRSSVQIYKDLTEIKPTASTV
mgnify:CR=1 FL=1